jgi:hypothetical protein
MELNHYNDGWIARMGGVSWQEHASDAWKSGWFDCDIELKYHERMAA